MQREEKEGSQGWPQVFFWPNYWKLPFTNEKGQDGAGWDGANKELT